MHTSASCPSIGTYHRKLELQLELPQLALPSSSFLPSCDPCRDHRQESQPATGHYQLVNADAGAVNARGAVSTAEVLALPPATD